MISQSVQKWYNLNRLHRADGPAVVYTDDGKFGEFAPGAPLHVETRKRGEIEWWWRGIACKNIDHWFECSKIDPEFFVFLKLKYA